MGVQFVRRPATSGELPFIAANGHPLEQVLLSLKRFATIANGGDIADSVHLHPVQIHAAEKIFYVSEKDAPLVHGDLVIIPDLEVLPTEGVLYKGDKPLALIRGLNIPHTAPIQDQLATTQQKKLEHARNLTDEADKLISIAESLKNRAKALLS